MDEFNQNFNNEGAQNVEDTITDIPATQEPQISYDGTIDTGVADDEPVW